MNDPRLLNLQDELKRLDKEIIRAPWKRVETLQIQRASVLTKLRKGVLYEPLF